MIGERNKCAFGAESLQGVEGNLLQIRSLHRSSSSTDPDLGINSIRQSEYIAILKSFSIDKLRKSVDLKANREENMAIVKSLGIDIPSVHNGTAESREKDETIKECKSKSEIRRPHTSQGVYRTDEVIRAAADSHQNLRLEIVTAAQDCPDVLKKRMVAKPPTRIRPVQVLQRDDPRIVWMDGTGLVDRPQREPEPGFFDDILGAGEPAPANQERPPSPAAPGWLGAPARPARAVSRSSLGRRLAVARARLQSAGAHVTQLDGRTPLCIMESDQPHVLSLARMPARPGSARPRPCALIAPAAPLLCSALAFTHARFAPASDARQPVRIADSWPVSLGSRRALDLPAGQRAGAPRRARAAAGPRCHPAPPVRGPVPSRPKPPVFQDSAEQGFRPAHHRRGLGRVRIEGAARPGRGKVCDEGEGRDGLFRERGMRPAVGLAPTDAGTQEHAPAGPITCGRPVGAPRGATPGGQRPLSCPCPRARLAAPRPGSMTARHAAGAARPARFRVADQALIRLRDRGSSLVAPVLSYARFWLRLEKL